MNRLPRVVWALPALALVRVLPETGVGLYARLAVAAAALFVPGLLVARALGRRTGADALVWTLALLTGALGVTFAVGGSLVLTLGLLALAGAGALPFALRRRDEEEPDPARRVVLAAGALFGVALWRVAGNVSGDGLFHLARARKLAELGQLEPGSVNEFADGGLHPGYAFPLWHAFLAALARLAGVDPAAVVAHAPSVLAPLAFLVAFEAGRALFRSDALAAAAVAAQVALIALAAGHGGGYASLALPGTASRQLLVPAALALVVGHVVRPSRALLAGAAAAGLALTLVHPTYSLFLGVPLAGFLVVRALADRTDARRIAEALVAFAIPTGAVLLALVPLARETASHGPSRGERARALEHYASQLAGDVDSYRLAAEVLVRGGPVAVAALALVPLAALARGRRWAAFVLGGTLAVLAAVLVAPVFTLLSDAVSLSQSRRLAGFVPFAFALVGGAAVLARLAGPLVVPGALAAGTALQLAYPGDFTRDLTHGGGPAAVTWFAAFAGVGAAVAATVAGRPREALERAGALPALAVLAFTLPVVVHAAGSWSAAPSRRDEALTPGLVRALRERVPERAVVFSDLETSYRIGAAAAVYVAANPPAHVADTERNRPYERRRLVIRFFRTGNPWIPYRFRAGWLVIDRKRFAVRPAGKPVFADARYSLYRIGRPEGASLSSFG